MPLSKATKRPETEADIRAIWTYVAERSPRAADALLIEIEGKFNFLAGSPLAGRARPELVADLRSFPSGSYVIFYFVVPTGVEVVRVLNGRREITSDDFK